MKNKKLIFMAVSLIFISKSFSQNQIEQNYTTQKIVLSPIVCYDQNNKAINLVKNPNRILYDDLTNSWFEGLIDFSLHKEKEFIYTIVEAQKLCTQLNCSYLIYGYVQKNENSWYANLKLYDSNKKMIVKDFFASDDINNFERFISTLEENIIGGVEQLLGLEFAQKKEECERKIEVRIPCSVYYWNPIDSRWCDVITGIVGANVGCEVFPPFKTRIINNTLVDFSATLKLSYAYGIGNHNRYPVNYHTATVSFPLTSYVHFTDEHIGFFGMGFFYEAEFLNIKQNYEDVKFMFQNMGGLETYVGYEFVLNENCTLYCQAEINHHFSKDSFVSLKPTLGTKFRVFKENKGE